MFERLRGFIKNKMQKVTGDLGMAKEFKDIFELTGVPSFNQFYYFGIFPWKYVYRGFYQQWHLLNAPTINKPGNRRIMESMNIAKAVTSELAGLIWSEQCEVHVSSGKQLAENETDRLDDYVQKVLKDNNIFVKMQEHIEQAMALGGGALKVWVESDHDENGNIVPGTGHIEIGYAMADQFVPTAWTNAKVTEGVFISREAKDGYYYTRLEWHKWNGKTYVIENSLYKADKKEVPNSQGIMESQDILGYHYPLDEIYPFLSPQTEINGLIDSLFTYYRTAIANNIDDNSPLGVSVYANAMTTLHDLDICYDSFAREFILGKKRIIVPSSVIKTVVDPNTGKMCRYFDANDEVYEALSLDDTEQLKIQDNSTELRVDEHVSAINALLGTLCLQLGFSSGTFSFDKATGLKTATEVISENSKTYKTIKSHQLQIKNAIEDLVHSIIEVSLLYDLDYKGTKITSLVSDDLEINVVFDDSILQDRQTNINEGITLINNGLKSKFTFMTETLGMTEEEAKQELERINQERNVTTVQVDDFLSGDE